MGKSLGGGDHVGGHQDFAFWHAVMELIDLTHEHTTIGRPCVTCLHSWLWSTGRAVVPRIVFGLVQQHAPEMHRSLPAH